MSTSAPVLLDEEAFGLRVRLAACACLLVAVLVGPLFIYPVFLMKVMCFAIFACAFNLLLGYVGLLAFGHAAFFGMASYMTAYGMKNWGLTPEIGVLGGTALATALGALFGLIAIRRQGIYFAMITLALAQMVFFFSVQTPRFTGGEDGIQNVPRGALFGAIDLSDDRAIYLVVAAVFFASLAFIFRVIESPFGQVIRAIRDNEERAISLGYRVNIYKWIVFVLSAGLSGLAGSMKAIVFQVATLNDVHWSMSGEPVIMALVGGLGTMLGPIVGAFTLVGMQTYLAELGSWVTVVQGAVFFISVMFFRKGIVGAIPEQIRRWL